MECTPTVFCVPRPEEIKKDLGSTKNPKGRITNSDLEMAGLLLLFLVMKAICPKLRETFSALFSDNSPTMRWARRLAAKGSLVAGQLLRALALRIKARRTSPLTPQHISGTKNRMTDIPSRSFGSVKKWHCKTNNDLLVLFNKTFSLPNQASWTVFQPSSEITTRVISVLQMKVFTLDEWRRLPRLGKSIGTSGPAMSDIWDWTLRYRVSPTTGRSEASQALHLESARVGMETEAKSELVRSVARSRPLARRAQWPMELIPPRYLDPTSWHQGSNSKWTDTTS